MAKNNKNEDPKNEQVDYRDVVAIYDELDELNKEHPEAVAAVNKKLTKSGPLDGILKFYPKMHDKYHIEVPVRKKTYCWLCLLGAFGVHHFYAGHRIKGLIYLAFCWTGIPVGLTLIDWMEAFPKQADESGMIIV